MSKHTQSKLSLENLIHLYRVITVNFGPSLIVHHFRKAKRHVDVSWHMDSWNLQVHVCKRTCERQQSVWTEEMTWTSTLGCLNSE